MKRRIPIHLKALVVLLVAIFIYSVIVPLLIAGLMVLFRVRQERSPEIA